MIKPVDEIPMNMKEKRMKYRERIREDLREALRLGVSKFEFVGDYNFKTLAQTASEEARHLTSVMVRNWFKDHPEYDTRDFSWSDIAKMDLIKIHSIKGETPDTRRVFCEIKLNTEEQIKEFANKRKEARRLARRV